MSTQNGGLKGRVRQQREASEQGQNDNGASNGNGGALDNRLHPMTQVKTMLDQMEPEIAKALPRHMTAERMARIVYTQVRAIPKLAECTAASLAGAILTCAQMGMEPGPTGEAWILPYWNDAKKCREAQFQLGYKGMAKLFWQHPLAQYLDAQTVYSEDEFEYEYGLNPVLRHKPRRNSRGERGTPVYWYAVAKLTNGGFRFIVLDRGDVERHRSRSQTPNSPAWKNDYNTMACKSAVKEMFGLLPKSPEVSRFVAQDGAVRTDLTADYFDTEPTYPDAVQGDVVDDDASWPAGDSEAPAGDPGGFPNDPGDWDHAADGTQ